MMNKNMVWFLYLVIGLLLYDLHFDICWLFNPHVHYIVHLGMAVLRAHVVFAIISLTFPRISELPRSLYLSSESVEMRLSHSPGAIHVRVHEVFHREIMPNVDVLKLLVSFILSFFFILFKVRNVQNISL